MYCYCSVSSVQLHGDHAGAHQDGPNDCAQAARPIPEARVRARDAAPAHQPGRERWPRFRLAGFSKDCVSQLVSVLLVYIIIVRTIIQCRICRLCSITRASSCNMSAKCYTLFQRQCSNCSSRSLISKWESWILYCKFISRFCSIVLHQFSFIYYYHLLFIATEIVLKLDAPNPRDYHPFGKRKAAGSGPSRWSLWSSSTHERNFCSHRRRFADADHFSWHHSGLIHGYNEFWRLRLFVIGYLKCTRKQVDPKKLLDDAIRKELVKHLTRALHDGLVFNPPKSKVLCNL